MGWGYAIGAGLSMIDGALQYDRQKALDRDEREFQREMAETTYKRQLDFWDKQNEYNLPANQRARLEDAGYNILDLMRNGSAMQTAGSLSPVASAGAGRGSQAPIGTMAEGAVALQNVQSQTRLNDSTVELQREKVRAEQLDNIRRTIENLEKQDTREARMRLNYYYRLERNLLEVGETTAEVNRSTALANDALTSLRQAQVTTEQIVQRMHQATTTQIEELTKTYASQIDLNKSQTRYFEQFARKLCAESTKLEHVVQTLLDTGLDISQPGMFGSIERVLARSNVNLNETVKQLGAVFSDEDADLKDELINFLAYFASRIALP